MARRKAIIFGMAAILGWASWSAAGRAEDLPTTGTFEGYYHRGKQGMGRFSFFVVPKELQDKLAKYDGKWIRLTVSRGEQLMNPGPATMLAVDKIEELPQPELKVTIKTRPAVVLAGQPFDVVVQMTDTRAAGERSVVKIDSTSVELVRPVERAIPAVGIAGMEMGAEWFNGEGDWQVFGGRQNLEVSTGRWEMLPGETWTTVKSFSAEAAKRDGEFHVRVGVLQKTGDIEKPWQTVPLEAWQDFTVIPANSRAHFAEEKVELSVKDVLLEAGAAQGWAEMQWKLVASAGKVRVPTSVRDGKVDAARYASMARLEGFTKDGTPVELEAVRLPNGYLPDECRTVFANLPESGAVVRGRFRKASRFAPPVARVTAKFLTDSGVLTATVTDHFEDKDNPPTTDFGAEFGGVKMRVRMAAEKINVREAVAFHVQVVNVAGKPVCWWKPGRGYGNNVVVEIDGKTLALPAEKAEYIGGWAAEHTVKNPDEWTVTLPADVKLAKGPHILRYTIVSGGGTYRNSAVPLIDGKVVSNETAFTVE